MDIKRCFELLEISPGATLDEVKKAYRDLTLIWHPDRFSNNPRLQKKAEEKTKEINNAKEKVIKFLSSNQKVEFHKNYSEEHRQKQIGKADDFIRECCNIGTNNRIFCVDLYMFYERWCSQQNFVPAPIKAFEQQLKELGLTILEEDIGLEFSDIYWAGVELNSYYSHFAPSENPFP